MSIRKHSARPSFTRFVQCVLGLAFLLAPMLPLLAASDARAKTTGTAIYGVTALDVAPGAAIQGVALLKRYRDGALKQAGNMGVTLLQEVEWPNRFIIFDAWKDQAAYDANEQAAHGAQLRDKLKALGGAPYDRRDYHVISVGPAETAAGSDIIYMQLHLDVFPPGIEATLTTLARHEAYTAWLHDQEERLLKTTVCQRDDVPASVPLDLTAFAPFLALS